MAHDAKVAQLPSHPATLDAEAHRLSRLATPGVSPPGIPVKSWDRGQTTVVKEVRPDFVKHEIHL